jgi:hypothetical protein
VCHRHSSVVCTSIIPLSFVCPSFLRRLYVRHSSVVCMSVIPLLFVRPSYVHCLSIVCLSVVRPLFVRPSFVRHSYVRCLSVVSFVCRLLTFVHCRSTWDPPHKQWLVRLEAGGMSLCAVCPILAGGGVAGYEVHRVRTSQVSPPRVSRCPSAPSSPVSTASHPI